MIPVSYVRQKQALGLGHAVLQARDLVGDEPFAVLLGDDIVDSARALHRPDDASLRAAGKPRHRPAGGAALARRATTASWRGSAAEDRVVAITDMVEKPQPDAAPSNLAIIGRYLLPPEIFGILEETRSDTGGEIQLTSALKTLLSAPAHRRISLRRQAL